MARKKRSKSKFEVESEFTITDDIARLKPEEDLELQEGLVAALYGTPKTIVYGCVIISGILFASWAGSGDIAFAVMGAALLSVSAMRYMAQLHYADATEERKTLKGLEKFEKIAAFGAWSTAAIVGFSGGYAAFVHTHSAVAVLVSVMVAAYAGGMSGRNASKPRITTGQSIATCAPFLIGLFLSGEWVYALIAALVGLNCYMTYSTVIGVHKTFIEKHYATKELNKIAHFDSLTGLANRNTFKKVLREITERDEDVSIISIDLDHFKHVNDTYGHHVGDLLLTAAAGRIENKVRIEDVAARVGGDEFFVILRGADALKTRSVALRILGALQEPFSILGNSHNPGASIGYAMRARGMDEEALLKCADLALYEAKENGRGQARGYNEDLKVKYDDRISLEEDLKAAIGTSQFDMHYQPIVDPKTGEVVLCEALMRWNHPVRGPVSPDAFIPVAEATGAIVGLGAWALEKACRDIAAMPGDMSVSVNLSPIQFGKNCEIGNDVRSALMKSGLPADRLTLEVTESAMVEDIAAVVEILEGLRKMGVKIAMDDFGTGHSSLAMISELPLDKIKVDRKFVQNMGRDRKGVKMMSSIALIARELDLFLIVEGVETEDQRETVTKFGVNAIQGYLYSKPLTAGSLRQWLEARRRASEEAGQKAA